MKEFLTRLFERIWAFFSEENDLNYVSSLPNPLSPEEEAEAVRLAEQGDAEARNKLIEHNLRLVVYIAKRFDNTGVEIDELISVGTLGLMKAVKSYDSEKKIKLATYASRCIENEILMYLRKMTRIRSEVSLEEPLNVDKEGNKLVLSDVLGTEPDLIYRDAESRVETDILRRLYENLEPRDREIIRMRYGLYGQEEKTQKEIADLMNISQSYISRLEKKILARLKKEFLKCE